MCNFEISFLSLFRYTLWHFLGFKTIPVGKKSGRITSQISTQHCDKMSNTSEQMLDIVEELESFLYTPYGVGTLAGVAIILTSFLWILGCCIYSCCRSQHRRNEEGIQEASRELRFIDTPIASRQQVNGTLSSGYNTGGTASFSLISSLASSSKTLTNSSMDPIIH